MVACSGFLLIFSLGGFEKEHLESLLLSLVQTMSEQKIDTDLVTLTRHLIDLQKKSTNAKGDFTLLMASIMLGCKFTSAYVRKAGLASM